MCVFSNVHIIAFPLIAFRSGTRRYHQVFSGCPVCPGASPLRRHSESLWCLFVFSSRCSWPSSIMWVVWFSYFHGPSCGLNRPCAEHIVCFRLKVFLPGNNCTALTNRTELEELKLYTGPVSTWKNKHLTLSLSSIGSDWVFNLTFDWRALNHKF